MDDILCTLVQGQTTLQGSIQALTTQMSQMAAPVVSVNCDQGLERPEIFEGDRTDTHRFLAAFELWASKKGAPLNNLATQSHVEAEWIDAALSLIRGRARTWAQQYI